MEGMMKIGIAGAGAVGCHYGSMLQQAGYDVLLLGRGEHLAALQNDGLVHESNGVHRHLTVKATNSVVDLGACDVVMICCKMIGLSAMLESLQGVIRKGALLVSLQNGVEAPDYVSSAFPHHAIVAGTAFIGARIENPGHVIHSAAGGIRLAQWKDGEGAVYFKPLVQALETAGVPTRMEEDARLMLWRKLLWNIGFNAITAITGRHARDVAAVPETLAIIQTAMQEAVSVARAEGVVLTDEDIAKHIRVTLEMGPVKTSMWQDIETGRLTEVDYINGYIVNRADALSLQAPVNRMLTALLHAIEGAA
jgi:2-dehydropantoate 2-reductase